MKKRFLSLLLIVTVWLSCSPTEPQDNPELLLKLEDVSCTEAWITVKTTLPVPAEINLRRTDAGGSTVSQILNLNTNDSLLYIDSLLPNHTYSLQVSSIKYLVFSSQLTVTTMDTTSHNFTFETFTFGDIGNSVLFDVAVINENSIWAVGEIRIADSSSIGYTTYNAVHWNGSQWELKRINMLSSCNPVTYPPLRAIWAFSENNIVVTSGGSIGWFDGITNIRDCTIRPLLTGSINKIWGSSSPTGTGNDLYVVGNNGNIARYLNGTWSRIESGTDVDLLDVWGTPDGNELWTCGWSNQSGRVSVSSIKNNGVESVWDSQTNRTLNTYSGTLVNSLWANGNSEFVLVGGQVLRHSLLDKSIVRREWVPIPNGQAVLQLGNYAYRIKGSNKNNIAATGDAAMIWHYNGQSWHKFEEVYNQEDRLYGLAVTDSLIVAVGKRFDNGPFGGGLLIIGRR